MDVLAFRLRSLPLGARLSFSFLVLVLLGGYAASGAYMQEHHKNRDEREGLSLTDLEGAYTGVRNPAGLIVALEAGHPEGIPGAEPLSEADREGLLAWLRGERVAEDYDSFDVDPVPADVLDLSCGKCHASRAADELRAEPYLDSWDAVKPLAFSRQIDPTPTKILLVSTHTHAIALGTVTSLIALLALFTFLPGFLRSLLMLGATGGLLLDLVAWWLARDGAGWVKVIVVGGAAHAGCMVLLMLSILIELWRPRGKG